jgi:putative SOS response-associated peptidase YedK
MDFMKYDDGCGRYTLKVKAGDLKKRYNLASVPNDIPESYDVRPGQTLPVIDATEEGKPQLEMMKWGLIPSFWAKDKKLAFSTFNARDDKVFQSGMWRSVYRKRALVPATGYFEWTKPPKVLTYLNKSFIFALSN